MKKGKMILTAVLSFVLAVCAFGCGGDPDKKEEKKDMFPYWKAETVRVTDRQNYTGGGVEFPSSLWQTPASERYETLDHDDIRGYFIESVQGTKVFCYVGIPASASESSKVPAVVLVHGATGTAYYDWVRKWTNLGYAAIAMDTEGRMPTADATMSALYPYVESVMASHGPLNTAFGDSDKPIEEQWVYHAVAAVIASRSFIASFEGVDNDRIGITGISYGGIITCLAAGYDDRYAWAAPVYGCLANMQGTGEIGATMKTRGAGVWDGVEPLKATKMPMLFVNGANDQHFSVKSTELSAEACPRSAISVRYEFLHSHELGAGVDEVFAFAEEICKKRTPLVRITEADADSGVVKFALHEDAKLRRVRQYYTTSDTLDKSTVWHRADVDVVKNTAYCDTEGKTHWFMGFEDTFGNCISTKVF